MAGPALIVGLGNPGPEYARTRHNIGFRVVDVLCARAGEKLRAVRGTPALATETRFGDLRVVLAQPTTFMNESGIAVRELSRYFKVPLEDIVLVHDELDLPFGTIRVKRGGGDAGHNGLRHVTRALGSPGYLRVRIGIGKPLGRQSGADYVLRAFSSAEEREVPVLVEEAADIALRLPVEGVEKVQNSLHGGAAEDRPKERRLRKSVVVAASVEQVWEAWTTSDGARTFFAPDARIELREDGPYEIYFDPAAAAGRRGTEGCKVISFEAPKKLSVTWNNPPEIAEVREEHARVDIALRAAGRDRTRVSLTHSGWGEGESWDRAFAYFERAWDVVLDRLRRRFEEGPIAWEA